MEHLQFDLPFEVRAVAPGESADGRTLEGRIVPYGETIQLGEASEAFAPGVFADVEPGEVVLLWQHDTTAPIGRMTHLTEESDGAYGTFRLADTDRAREAHSLISDGIVRGLSVGFIPGQTRTAKGVRTHLKAMLKETSLVTFPAYPSAGVLAVREEEPMDETPEETTVEESPAPAVVDLGPIEQRMDSHDKELREVRNLISNIRDIPTLEPKVDLIARMTDVVLMVAENPGQNRALADVIGTGPGNAEGLLPVSYASELLGVLDPSRPFFAAAGTYPFPPTGFSVHFPRVTQHTQVAKRTAEKTEIASREMTVGMGTYTAEWFAGGNDVGLELILQSTPDAQTAVTEDLLDQYAIVTEDEFVTDVEAGATVGGGTLDTSSWGAFAADVIATSKVIRTATGRPGDRLALTTASWTALVGLLNPGAPASLPGSGPDLTAESVDVKGVLAFHSPESTVDVQFNTKALRKSERPPLTVTANNVALMGRDIGVLGATIFLPLYPAGIIKYVAA